MNTGNDLKTAGRKNIGEVVAVRGSVIDVRFPRTIPLIHNIYRARRLERFLTQPFFTTEQFTGHTGRMVSLDDALEGCERILNDEFSQYPENALYMIRKIDEARKT